MPGRSRQRMQELGRALLTGTLVGVIVLAGIVLAWRERREDPIVLEVRPMASSDVIRVYVGGAVASPGIYSLPRGSRIADAIELAGGVEGNADLNGLGMAAVVHDGDLITVPVLPATPTAIGSTEDDRTTAAMFGTVPPRATAPPTQASTLININRASVDELDALPRIGPVLAQRIVDYRQQHGPFQSLEDLSEIQGISDRMVEILRPHITLGQ